MSGIRLVSSWIFQRLVPVRRLGAAADDQRHLDLVIHDQEIILDLTVNIAAQIWILRITPSTPPDTFSADIYCLR
jgi:hypothetical protein